MFPVDKSHIRGMPLNIGGAAMKKITFAIIALLIISACATQPLLKETQSGYPEGVFENTDVETVKSKIIQKFTMNGIMLIESSPNMLVFGKEITGTGAAILATLAVNGNAYSSTPMKKVRFVINQTGEDVLVVVYEWIESRSPFGQSQIRETKNNKQANQAQRVLFSLGAK